jgi:hypothetical protein
VLRWECDAKLLRVLTDRCGNPERKRDRPGLRDLAVLDAADADALGPATRSRLIEGRGA